MSENQPNQGGAIDDLLGGQGAPPPTTRDQEKIEFYSHSQLFYYWPIWFMSFIFAGITYFRGQDFVIKNASALKGAAAAKMGTLTVKMVGSPALGLTFLIVFVCVVLFTAVDIRGVWTAALALLLIVFCLMFYTFYPDRWSAMLRWIGHLNIFMNFYFYLVTGVVMAFFWLITFFLYDRRHYIIFRPTQLTIVEEIGEGEKNFDTIGLVFDKKRDNFFQHLLLGFGSGDLIITTSGGQHMRIHFPNVMRIGKKLERIHRLREMRGRA